jgi:hypothetical protein
MCLVNVEPIFIDRMVPVRDIQMIKKGTDFEGSGHGLFVETMATVAKELRKCT